VQLGTWRWFYGELVSAGFLKDEKLETRQLTTYVPGMQLTQYQYFYTAVGQPHISIKDGSIIFLLNSLSIDEITGISQNGANADVQGKVSYVPTTAATTLDRIVQDAYSKFGAGFVNPLTCPIPSLDQAAKSWSETRPFGFKKFDDGWRVNR
jgi:hypothetical protein